MLNEHHGFCTRHQSSDIDLNINKPHEPITDANVTNVHAATHEFAASAYSSNVLVTNSYSTCEALGNELITVDNNTDTASSKSSSASTTSSENDSFYNELFDDDDDIENEVIY